MVAVDNIMVDITVTITILVIISLRIMLLVLSIMSCSSNSSSSSSSSSRVVGETCRGQNAPLRPIQWECRRLMMSCFSLCCIEIPMLRVTTCSTEDMHLKIASARSCDFMLAHARFMM